MLSKLIKYDWKSVCRVEGLLAIIMLAYGLLAAIMLQTPVYSGFVTGHKTTESMQAFGFISGGFGFVALWILIVGVEIASVIYLAVRFYRSMYDDEGYLTHTLPSTTMERLGSKLIVGYAWFMVVSLAVVVSLGLIAVSALIIGHRAGYGFQQMKDGILEFFPYMPEFLSNNKGTVVHLIVLFVFTALLNPFIRIARVFGALTIGQLFKKNRGLMGVVFYFVISWGTSFVLNVVSGIMRAFDVKRVYSLDEFGSSGFFSRMITVGNDMSLAVNFAVAVALVFVTRHIIDNKLNLI